jgi:hypothetical protein
VVESEPLWGHVNGSMTVLKGPHEVRKGNSPKERQGADTKRWGRDVAQENAQVLATH